MHYLHFHSSFFFVKWIQSLVCARRQFTPRQYYHGRDEMNTEIHIVILQQVSSTIRMESHGQLKALVLTINWLQTIDFPFLKSLSRKTQIFLRLTLSLYVPNSHLRCATIERRQSFVSHPCLRGQPSQYALCSQTKPHQTERQPCQKRHRHKQCPQKQPCCAFLHNINTPTSFQSHSSKFVTNCRILQ